MTPNAFDIAELGKCDVVIATKELLQEVEPCLNEVLENRRIFEFMKNSPMRKAVFDVTQIADELNIPYRFPQVFSIEEVRNEAAVMSLKNFNGTQIVKTTYFIYVDMACGFKGFRILKQNWDDTDQDKTALTGAGLFSLLLATNKIILEKDELIDVEKRVKSHKKKGKKGRASRRVVREYKCYKIVGERRNQIKEKHKILCPAWSVRGHIRHYKSGKVVFINPYIKGKKRNEGEFPPKERKLFPTIKVEVESGKAEGL